MVNVMNSSYLYKERHDFVPLVYRQVRRIMASKVAEVKGRRYSIMILFSVSILTRNGRNH